MLYLSLLTHLLDYSLRSPYLAITLSLGLLTLFANPKWLMIEIEQLQLNFSFAFHDPGTLSIPSVFLSFLFVQSFRIPPQQQFEHGGSSKTTRAAFHLVHEDHFSLNARSDNAEDPRGPRPEQLWLRTTRKVGSRRNVLRHYKLEVTSLMHLLVGLSCGVCMAIRTPTLWSSGRSKCVNYHGFL